MRYTLFNINNEEADLPIDNEQNQEEENEDVLTSESPIEKLESSFNKTADDTAKEIESFENCSNCEEELKDQVVTIDEQLSEQPEEVTEDVVEVAQESFYNSLSKVLTIEEFQDTKNKLSFESNITPVEKLVLTREGIMDVIKKIIEKIKQAFQQVGQFFKKLWVKFVIFMDGTAKRAGEVHKKYKGKQLNSIVLSKEQIEVIKEKIGLLVNSKGSIYASQLLPFIKYNITSLDKVTDNNTYKNLGVNSAVSKTLRIFQNPDSNMMFNLLELVTSEYKDKKDLSKPVQIVSVIESEIKAVFFQLGKDDSGNYTDKKYEDCVYETVTINKDVNVPNNVDTKKIVDDLKIIELYAKGAGTYKDRLLEVQSSARKSLDQIAKDNKDESYDKTQLKFIQILGTKMILDNIMQYVKNCKNMLYVSEFILKSLDDITTEEFSNEGITDLFKKKRQLD